MPVLLLELNEVNFEGVQHYVSRGRLPVLGRLIERHGIFRTESEDRYELLEPWIQWVTAHTGLPYADHNVFRLGDIVHTEIPQIWEMLEESGLKVGAISPMNAKNRCRQPAFFVPDPWTPTEVSGTVIMKRLHQAVSQAVNDNARAHVSASSAAWLLLGALRYARRRNYSCYLGLLKKGLSGASWAKALVLDQLLADLFVGEVARRRPDFASLFLNGAAHIQHHYMFNSSAYSGRLRNPEWYAGRDEDPVERVYELYDRIVAQIENAFPDARLMIATALHQDPHSAVTHYWRLRDHAAFLHGIGAAFQRVEPRMSRDFLVQCSDYAQALRTAALLESVQAADGAPLFAVDNRGVDLFVTLVWDRDVPADFEYRVGKVRRRGLREEVTFVAIKNGEHNGIGYLIDTGQAADVTECFPLADLPRRIAKACGVAPPLVSAAGSLMTDEGLVSPAAVQELARPQSSLE